MEDYVNIIYTWLFIQKDGTWKTQWSRAIKKPPCGDPENYEWIEWNKPLPEDIDTKSYTIAELEEWYNNTYDENGELKAV